MKVRSVRLKNVKTGALTELPAGRSPITTHVVYGADKPTHVERAWARAKVWPHHSANWTIKLGVKFSIIGLTFTSLSWRI